MQTLTSNIEHNMAQDGAELLKRAMAAYFRAGEGQQPSSNDSGLMTHDGHKYMVLRNISGTLAVYRVRNDGMLKRLKRWPGALDTESAVDKGADVLMQAVKLADRLIAKAADAEKPDLKKLRKLIATAGFVLDSTDAGAGEDLREVWGLTS